MLESVMRASAGLRLDYLPAAECRAAQWADVLGVATFSSPLATEGRANGGLGEIPVAEINMPLLLGSEVCEVWRSEPAVESGRHNRVHFRRSETLLFGCIALAESGIATAGAADTPSALQTVTGEAYREICATLDAFGYPHLLRVWNYLADINRDSHGTERYRQFNRARHEALHACGRTLTGNVPAASALGAASGSPLVVYFLAGRTAPTCIENPRQVSAYRYPRQYGTHAPAFSRATLLRQRDSLMLFISGTASIVGHRSLHLGDAAAQTRETLANIGALLEEANRVTHATHFAFANLACKVYVRRPQDLPAIHAELQTVLDPARVIYLQADICRADLLVEMEATGTVPLRADA